MRRADVPRDRPAAESSGRSVTTTARSQSRSSSLRRAASRISVIGAGGTTSRSTEELGPPVDRAVALAEVLDQLVGDPGGDVAARARARRSRRGRAASSAPPAAAVTLASLRRCRPPASLSSARAPRRCARLLDLEVAAVAVHVDRDPVAGLEPAAEHHPRELVLDEPLDRPPQRARAELGVVALVARAARRASSVNSTSIRCARSRRASRSSSSLRDLGELLLGEGPEDDDLVDPVDELRPEALRAGPPSGPPSAARTTRRCARTAGSGRRRGSRS